MDRSREQYDDEVVGVIRVGQLIYSDSVIRGADVLIVGVANAQLRAGAVDPLIIAAASTEYAEILKRSEVPVRLLPYVGRHRLDGHLRLFLSLWKDPSDVDVVHAHGIRALLLAHALRRVSSVWADRPIVYTLHDQWRSSPLLARARTRIEQWYCRRTDAVIACSAAMMPLACRTLGADRVTLIVNGVQVETAQSEPAETGFAPETPVIGIVGRLDPDKRVDIFLAVAARLCADRNDLGFIVVGDGPARTELERMARQLQITSRVRFLGQVRNMPAIYSAMTVLLHTADHEGTPLVLLEAMASGVPIVSTSVGGIPGIIRAGSEGLLADAGDVVALAEHVSTMLNQPDRRQALAARARERVIAECTSEVMAERLEKVYLGASATERRHGTSA